MRNHAPKRSNTQVQMNIFTPAPQGQAVLSTARITSDCVQGVPRLPLKVSEKAALRMTETEL